MTLPHLLESLKAKAKQDSGELNEAYKLAALTVSNIIRNYNVLNRSVAVQYPVHINSGGLEPMINPIKFRLIMEAIGLKPELYSTRLNKPFLTVKLTG